MNVSPPNKGNAILMNSGEMNECSTYQNKWSAIAKPPGKRARSVMLAEAILFIRPTAARTSLPAFQRELFLTSHLQK